MHEDDDDVSAIKQLFEISKEHRVCVCTHKEALETRNFCALIFFIIPIHFLTHASIDADEDFLIP